MLILATSMLMTDFGDEISWRQVLDVGDDSCHQDIVVGTDMCKLGCHQDRLITNTSAAADFGP